MLVLGHRGASVEAQENTPEAFELADRMGADGVELDVRRTADGQLVVMHDPMPDDFDAHGVPTFADVLDACGDRMLVNVEIKNSKADPDHDPTMAMVVPVIDELRRRGSRFRHRWLISSFSWSTVAACREYAPDIATACLTMAPVDEASLEALAAVGHSALHPWEVQVDDSLLARCHRVGLAVNTWTCNDPVRMVELAELGVDGVCTDVPDVALRVLGRSGGAADPVVVEHDSLTVSWERPASPRRARG